MKKLLITILITIVLIFGYNQYQDYRRFNGPDTNYTPSTNIDTNYHDKNILYNYHYSITDLNGYINTQWSAHRIDVVNPEKENKQIKHAIHQYAQKLAQVKHYENILEQSAKYKNKNLNNKDIKLIENTGLTEEAFNKLQDKKEYKKLILNSFSKKNYGVKEKDPLIFEVQKMLTKNGFPCIIDGIYKTQTIENLKAFETKHNLLPDGILDPISLEYLLESN